MTKTTAPHGAPWRNFHGRRHGKTLRPRQIAALEQGLPALSVPCVGWDENPDRRPLDLRALFGDDRPVWLEIGFGGGEHLLALAEANPGVGFVGCEPFVNGVAMLLPHVLDRGLTNIRVHMGDARDVLDVLPDASVSRAFLLYPDPWPKRRHLDRRFVNAANIAPLARVLAPGAPWHVATDIPDYVRHTLQALEGVPEFALTNPEPDTWRTPWADWHRTRYEAKALREGRSPHYLTFRRQ